MLSACGFSWELVLVGNYIEGSDDETPRIVGELAARWPNMHAVIRPKEGMMGWDMRMGLDAAHGTYIGVIDGDEQFPTEAVVDCLLKAETEGLDLVKTYRVVRHDGLYRRFISAAFNTTFRLLFGGPGARRQFETEDHPPRQVRVVGPQIRRLVHRCRACAKGTRAWAENRRNSDTFRDQQPAPVFRQTLGHDRVRLESRALSLRPCPKAAG